MIDNPLKDDNSNEEQDDEQEEKLEQIPEEEVTESPISSSDRSRCTRFEVCGNIVYGSTCPQCWKDIREQLEVTDCECGNNRFKFIPSGDSVTLRCQDCETEQSQVIECTADPDRTDPRSVAQ